MRPNRRDNRCPSDGLRSAVELIRRNDRFLITTHVNPEGDALGSELAFLGLLRRLGKKGIIVNDDPVPAEYRFLPGAGRIRLFPVSGSVPFGCMVTLDCSDADRAGRVGALNACGRPTLNIDHHVSNRRFALVNWVRPDLSSCAELIYLLYKTMRVPFDRAAALSLYVGMMTDTGSFRYSSTGARTHTAVAELMAFDIDVNAIYRRMYENVPSGEARLVSAVLSTLRLASGGQVAWFQANARTLGRARPGSDFGERVLSFGRSIQGVKVVVLFREVVGASPSVRVNLRSQGGVDVNAVASRFGGGGHPAASGATVPGPLEIVSRRVLGALRESLAHAPSLES